MRICGALWLAAAVCRAAVVADTSVDLEAAVSDTVPHITLNWGLRLSGSITAQTLLRRVHGASNWTQTNVLATSATQFADSNAVAGVQYEYWLKRTYNVLPYEAHGYLLSGLRIAPVERRGTLVLLVDASLAGELAPDIEQLVEDLAGDGWQVLRHDIPRAMSVTNVRELIRQNYLANSNDVKTVYVLGHVPVPYSGQIAPDGHSNHSGAWPADVYYAELNSTWTDASVNSTSASDPRNRNVPGDGKFDQSTIPSPVELQIGRVDLYNMTLFPNTTVTEAALMRRYLRRAHDYRTLSGVFSNDVLRRVLVDDSFGYYMNAEAFANTAYRTASAWCGRDAGTLVNSDWFGTLGTGAFLFAYGAGGGSYTSAGGVGTSTDFGLYPSKAVFTCLFGSYFGDWDNNNNFLRASLASHTESYVLSCAWAGRPQWFFHHMSLGEPIGYSAQLSQNSTFSRYFPAGSGAGQVHVALMGDPTLRLYPVTPPSNARGRGVPGAIEFAWDAAAGTNVLGYYLYRATALTALFVRVTNDLLAATAFTDSGLSQGDAWTYMVRSVTLERSPGGTYTNLSQGAFATATAGSGAPFSPGALEVFAPSSTPLRLAWADNSDDETGFIVERATAPAGAFSIIGSTAANENSFDDPGPLTHGAAWRYRVAAAGINATSPPGSVATVLGSAGFIETIANIFTADVSNEMIAVPVQRYGGPHGTVTATCQTSDGIARAGRDYLATNVVLTWTDGAAGLRTTAVPLVPQAAPRLARSFKVNLANAAGGASLTEAKATIVLLTDARSPVVAPWNEMLLGSDDLRHPGAAAMAEGVIGSTMYGGGIPNGTYDACRFIHQSFTGDAVITAFVSMDPYATSARLALMVRQDLKQQGRCASVCIGNGRITLQQRTNDWGATITNGHVSSSANGVWLRLLRAGGTFTAYYSVNGTTWTKIAASSMAMNSAAFWGIAHSSSQSASDFHLASFSNVTVTPFVSAVPVCSNDYATMEEDGGTIPIYVLTNDYDPDGGALAVISAGLAANGSVQIAGGGTHVTYRPNPDYHGTDTFSYIAREPDGQTNGARVFVIVTPVNDPPKTESLRLLGKENEALAFVLPASDAEGDALSYNLLAGPSHGSLTGALPAVVYLPATNFTGLETLQISVADSYGAAATAMVWITVAPNAMLSARLLAWGQNSYGQLGLGHKTSQPTPVLVSNSGPVTAIAAGNYHSLIVGTNGAPKSCGYNSGGILGIGTTVNTSDFTSITSLSGISNVAAGLYHSIFVATNGQLWVCGQGQFWQLGTGTNLNELTPVRVPDLSNIVAAAAGYMSTFALDAFGCVWSCGLNQFGELGNGTNVIGALYGPVSGLSNIVAIAAGWWHVLALDTAGQLWAWGYNSDGQIGLGLGAGGSQMLPVAVPGMTNIASIAAGAKNSYALRRDGTLFVCGDGYYGQLGSGSNNDTNVFVTTLGIGHALAVAASYDAVYVFGAAGSLWGAGRISSGTASSIVTNRFARVAGADNVVGVAGGGHVLALQQALANQPPVAHNVTVSGGSGVPIPITLTASDPEGDALSFTIVDPPAQGALAGTAPVLTYTSDMQFIGTDTFTFVAADWQPGNVATGLVFVVPEPLALLVIALAACAVLRLRNRSVQ